MVARPSFLPESPVVGAGEGLPEGFSVVWASPLARVLASEGGEYQFETFSEPVRVLRGDAWVPVDESLVAGSEGGPLVPVASPLAVEVSAGGPGPLVRWTGADGSEVAIDWPGRGPLPVPVVTGGTASFRDVVAGVSLHVITSVSGVSVTFEVAGWRAAQRLVRRGLEVVAQGVALEERRRGLALVDEDGRRLRRPVAARVWDSSGFLSAVGSTEVRRFERPTEGDLVVSPRARLAGDVVTVRPPRRALERAGARFPVFGDAVVPVWSDANRAMVDQRYPSESYVGWTGDEGMGYQNASDWSRKRLFWRFDTTPLRDAARDAGTNGFEVYDSEFSALETWAWSCTKAGVRLHSTEDFDSSTNWNNQPASRGLMDERTVAYGWDPGAGDCGEDTWVDFSGDALDAEMRTLAVDLDRKWTRLRLRATDENKSVGWKRWDQTAKLTAKWNTSPDLPSELAMRTPTPNPDECTTEKPFPRIPKVTGKGPTLQARISDPDGKDNPFGRFELRRTDTAENEIWFIGDGTKNSLSKVDVPTADWDDGVAGITTEGTLTWRVRAKDGRAVSEWVPCKVVVDAVPPVPAVVSPREPGPYVAGERAVFDVELPDPDEDVWGYRYSVNQPEVGSADFVEVDDTGDVPPIGLTLDLLGPHTLRVWSVDLAGNLAGVTSVDFDVVSAIGGAGFWWRFDDDPSDGESAGSPGAVLSGAAGAGPGAGAQDPVFGDLGGRGEADTAVVTTGVDEYLEADDIGGIDLTQGVTASAWVKGTAVSATQTFVSVGEAVSGQGNGDAALALDARAGDCVATSAAPSCWSAVVRANEDDGQSRKQVLNGNVPIAPDRWTHVAATMNPSTGLLRLFVDRELAGEMTVTFPLTVPEDTVTLIVGAQVHPDGTTGLHFEGSVDEVQVLPGVATPAQIRVLYADAARRLDGGEPESVNTVRGEGRR